MADRKVTNKSRKPCGRRQSKTHFSRAMWHRWMAERTDRRAAQRRAAIAQFRRQLESWWEDFREGASHLTSLQIIPQTLAANVHPVPPPKDGADISE